MAQQTQQEQAHPGSCLRGSVRTCMPYGGELARHRLITADGHDYVVATVHLPGRKQPFTTGAYPVSRGYLVMARQPLYEVKSLNGDAAREQHEQLVAVLVEAGVGVVRARRALAARQRAENAELQRGHHGLRLVPTLKGTRSIEMDLAATQTAQATREATNIAVLG
jgi:hypothetical protein